MKKFLTSLWLIMTILVFLAASTWSLYYFPWKFMVGFLTLLLIVSCFYLWKFVKIIMVLENDLGQATQALEEVQESMQQIIDMKLYFDTPEVQQMVSHVMESVKMAKFAVNTMIKSFTDRSKQKFIMVIDEEPELPESAEEKPPQQPAQHQQEQGPKEGTVLSVERSNI